MILGHKTAMERQSWYKPQHCTPARASNRFYAITDSLIEGSGYA
jgi:hypothetical protein